MALYNVTREEQQTLSELASWWQFNRTRISRLLTNEPSPPDNRWSAMFRAPSGGLPPRTGQFAVGKADCLQYRLDPNTDTLVDTGQTQTIYNYRTAMIFEGELFFAHREPFGPWIVSDQIISAVFQTREIIPPSGLNARLEPGFGEAERMVLVPTASPPNFNPTGEIVTIYNPAPNGSGNEIGVDKLIQCKMDTEGNWIADVDYCEDPGGMWNPT